MSKIMYKGVLYGSGGSDDSGENHRELTQAEYNALSEAEKKDGTVYFITDGVSDTIFVDDPNPIGAIQAYGGSTAPYGWLICDGRAVSRTEYPELFAVISTTYGSGDGTSTFNLPDLKGRVIIGESTSHALGSTGGEETHTLTVEEMPSHTHGINFPTQNGDAWGIYGGGGAGGWGLGIAGANNNYGRQSNQNTGGGQAHNNMPPYTVTNYIIKAKDGGSVKPVILELIDTFYPVGSYYETTDTMFDPNIEWGGTWSLEIEGQVHVSAGTNYTVGATGGEATHTLTVDEMPSHKHTFSNSYGWTGDFIPGASATMSGTNNILASPYHAYTGSTNNLIINSSGGGQAHNIMQPYIVVNRWHRIA